MLILSSRFRDLESSDIPASHQPPVWCHWLGLVSSSGFVCRPCSMLKKRYKIKNVLRILKKTIKDSIMQWRLKRMLLGTDCVRKEVMLTNMRPNKNMEIHKIFYIHLPSQLNSQSYHLCLSRWTVLPSNSMYNTSLIRVTFQPQTSLVQGSSGLVNSKKHWMSGVEISLSLWTRGHGIEPSLRCQLTRLVATRSGKQVH